VEVDFIIETARRQSGRPPQVVAVEVKRSAKWDRAWEKPLRSLLDNPGLKVDRLIGVYCGSKSYRFDRLTVLPLKDFVAALQTGDVF
jgi:hypothetical protein